MVFFLLKSCGCRMAQEAIDRSTMEAADAVSDDATNNVDMLLDSILCPEYHQQPKQHHVKSQRNRQQRPCWKRKYHGSYIPLSDLDSLMTMSWEERFSPFNDDDDELDTERGDDRQRQRRRLSSPLSTPSTRSVASSSSSTSILQDDDNDENNDNDDDGNNAVDKDDEGEKNHQGEQDDNNAVVGTALVVNDAMLWKDKLSSSVDNKTDLPANLLDYSRRNCSQLQKRRQRSSVAVLFSLRRNQHRPKCLSKKLLCRLHAMS